METGDTRTKLKGLLWSKGLIVSLVCFKDSQDLRVFRGWRARMPLQVEINYKVG